MTVTPAATPHTFGHAMLAHWPLDPTITYLNHGTVGVVPKRVLAAQQAIRDEIERQPARFCVRELADVGEFVMRIPPRMRTAAAVVAELVGCEEKDLAFVDNATVGYTAEYVASRIGARVTTVTLPFPETTPEKVIAVIEAAITPRTRMLVVD